MSRSRIAEVGWLILLAGLPFAILLNPASPMWYCHYAWLGMGLILLTGWWLAHGGQMPLVSVPLGLWWMWAMGKLGWMLLQPPAVDQLSISPLMLPVFHLGFLFLFLLVASAQWTPDFLPELCRWIARSGAVVVAYGLCQTAALDQFYHPVDSTLPTIVGGVFGNPSLFGAHLALLLPFFLLHRGWRWRGIAGVTLVLIFQTHSLAAWGAALVVLSWWLSQTAPRVLWGLVPIALLISGYLHTHPADLDWSGRLTAWPAFWTMFKQLPIFGFWTGYVMQASWKLTDGPLFNWRQVHNEYFQILIEQGIVGASCLVWWLWETTRQAIQTPASPLKTCLVGVLLAFAVNGLANFPGHLAVTAALFLTAYIGMVVLTRERGSYNLDGQRGMRTRSPVPVYSSEGI